MQGEAVVVSTVEFGDNPSLLLYIIKTNSVCVIYVGFARLFTLAWFEAPG